MRWIDDLLDMLMETFIQVLLPIAVFVAGLRWAFSAILSDDVASVFETAALFTALCVSVWWFVDKTILRKLDTITELKNGNIAYGLALLALAIVVLAGALVGS